MKLLLRLLLLLLLGAALALWAGLAGLSIAVEHPPVRPLSADVDYLHITLGPGVSREAAVRELFKGGVDCRWDIFLLSVGDLDPPEQLESVGHSVMCRRSTLTATDSQGASA